MFTCQILSPSVCSVALGLQKTPNFCRFWTSEFCGVANWRHTQKTERGCTTVLLPHPWTFWIGGLPFYNEKEYGKSKTSGSSLTICLYSTQIWYRSVEQSRRNVGVNWGGVGRLLVKQAMRLADCGLNILQHEGKWDILNNINCPFGCAPSMYPPNSVG